eukprot:2450192-Prymnesium_polylepis.2
MALQFPKDEFDFPEARGFREAMIAFENRIKRHAVTCSQEMFGKSSLPAENVDARFTPMLRYPRYQKTGSTDKSKPPTLRIKIPFWENEFKYVELYDDTKRLCFPTTGSDNPSALMSILAKGSRVATILSCGGVWIANRKFGCTWRLFQAVVQTRLPPPLSAMSDPSEMSRSSRVLMTSQEVPAQSQQEEEAPTVMVPLQEYVALQQQVANLKSIVTELELAVGMLVNVKEATPTDEPKPKFKAFSGHGQRLGS